MYGIFAGLYDLLMDLDYDAWLDRIEALWQDKKPELVLDLCCGTGGMTEALLRRGYAPIGVDASADMLAVAREKSGDGALFLCQDMRELDLYGTVGAAVCLCDSLNYLLDPADLTRVFRLVNNFLDPGALFIFDMNTPYQFREVLGNNTFGETLEDAAYLWENEFDEEDRINRYGVTFFTRRADGAYDRAFELHEERAYSREEVETCLRESGLELLAVYDGYSDRKPGPSTSRWVFVTREKGKKGTIQ